MLRGAQAVARVKMRARISCLLYFCGGSLLFFLAAINAGFGGTNQKTDPDHPKFMEFQKKELVPTSHDTVRQVHRRHLVKKVCERTASTANVMPTTASPKLFSQIFVNDKYKFMYCEVPKVGSTNWKRVLLVLSGEVNVTDPVSISPADAHGKLGKSHLHTLSSFSDEEVQYRLNTYYKFMFVREPLERLLSAYKNKFTTSYNTYFPEVFGRKIIREYRKKPSSESLRRGHDVKFDEFVHYLLNPKTSKQPLNAHWRHYYKLCHPCLVKYNFVGKYVTLGEDAQEVLRHLHVDHLVSYPAYSKLRHTSDIMKQAYANITSEEVHELWRMYSVDFSMFGYEYPDFTDHVH